MAKKQKPSRDEQNKTDMEKMQKRVKNLLPSKADIPASISIQQAEELKCRITELEAELIRITGTAANPSDATPKTNSQPASTSTSDSTLLPASIKNTISQPETFQKKKGLKNLTTSGRATFGFGLRPKLVLAITLTAFLAVGILSYFAFVRSNQTQTTLGNQLQETVQESSEYELGSLLQAEVTSAEEFLRNVAREVSSTANYSAQLFAEQEIVGNGDYWSTEENLVLLQGGQMDNPNTDPASVFIPVGVPLTESLNADLNTMMYLDLVAPSVLNSNTNIVALYYINPLGATVYYPNIDLSNVVPPDFNVTDQVFYKIGAPETNPGRENVWTPPYQDPAGTGLIVTNVSPIYDQRGQFHGILGADVQLAKIADHIAQIKIGETGFAFLIDPQGHIIAMPQKGYEKLELIPEEVPVNETPKQSLLDHDSQELQTIFLQMTQGLSGLTRVVIQGEEHFVSYGSLETTGYSLGLIVPVVEMNKAVIETSARVAEETQATFQYGLLLLVLVVLGSVLISIGVSRILTSPLELLTSAARQISAGDLGQTVAVTSRDEIGTLATTFNNMTLQLRDLFGSLEQRVRDRTHDLELASEIGSILTEQVTDQSRLLSEAVEMIRSRFDLYYTQIYLVDPSGRSLALRAGTGETGKQLLSRSHHLPISIGSLNGRAAMEKRAIIVADTRESGNFLPNPLLPDTRSEMAVPLMVGGQVVGVLDIQSNQPGALNESNLPAFEALAGQLAVAIQNASLFAQAEQARAELEDQARRLTHTGWDEFLNAVERSETLGFIYHQNEILPVAEAPASEAENSISTPIKVSGANVGEIRLADNANRAWTDDDCKLVEAVAEQLARQVENLRLLKQTEQYRQEAEQAVRRLTREGWQAYSQSRKDIAGGFVYDLNDVKPLPAEMDGGSATGFKHPLRVRDEVIGELEFPELADNLKNAGELVNEVAARLGEHMENLRLSEQNKKRAHELETVAEVSTTASTVLNPDELLQSVVNLTQESFGIYHAHIYLANEAWNTLLLAAGAGKVGRQMAAAGHAIPMDAEQSLVARSARERQAIIVNDTRSEPGFLLNPLLPDTRSEMAVPMIVGDKILGVFDVQSEKKDHFTREDASIYATLAAQVAIALQNARLYVEQAATVLQLRELDRLKSSFLANMSHELRTPLNSILGFADVIIEELDGPLTENMSSDLKLIQKNGQHLLHLINDVLDMAKIDAGRMNLNPERFRIHDMLEEVTSITSTLASEKNLALFIEEDSDSSTEIFADRTRLRQVMINLVNNALKFTEKGEIRLRAVRRDDLVTVRVCDTGVGIPPDKLEVVFQEFTQVDTSTTRRGSGTGLGLPISRRLIEMHGGRLWAESSGIPGEGSTFFVELPLQAVIVDPIEIEKVQN